MVYYLPLLPVPALRSEVDPTGSLWYKNPVKRGAEATVLKLTLPGHYGIRSCFPFLDILSSEVDPTGSLWYTRSPRLPPPHLVLKLTLPGHYGIKRTQYASR